MDFYAEQILSIAFDDSGDLIIDGDKTIAGHHVVQRARLKVDSLKWIASRLFPKRYGDKPQEEAAPQQLTISWQTGPATDLPDGIRQAPKQIVYQPRSLPGDLSEEDWSTLHDVLDLIKRTIPSDDESPPALIFDVIRHALLRHFAAHNGSDPVANGSSKPNKAESTQVVSTNG